MRRSSKKIAYVGKMDPEVVKLCDALNAISGIETYESCCGHGEQPFRIWFQASSFKTLGLVCYFVSACHTGQSGWSVRATSDCSAKPATFCFEGPPKEYDAANIIAKCIMAGL